MNQPFDPPAAGLWARLWSRVADRGRDHVFVPPDFPVPTGAELVTTQRSDREATATWDIAGECKALDVRLTHALRRRGFAVSVETAPDTLLEGGVLWVGRGGLRGVVSWCRRPPYEDGPIRMTATFTTG